MRVLFLLFMLIFANKTYAVDQTFTFQDDAYNACISSLAKWGPSDTGIPWSCYYNASPLSYYSSKDGPSSQVEYFYFSEALSCPANAPRNNNNATCSCPSPYVWNTITYQCDVPACPSGQTFNTEAAQCVPICPSGQTYNVQAAACVTACSGGYVSANTIPALNTSSTQCVLAGSDYCGQLGVDVTAFVPQCSGVISGNPTSCLKSDLSAFSIPQCPELTCSDGSKVRYPATCPITSQDCSSLGAGWELVTLADGATQTCVMQTPDNDQHEPCFTISPTQAPLCATEGNNCALQNGKPICLYKSNGQPPPGATCYTNAGEVYCLNNQPVSTQTKGPSSPLNLGGQACQSVTTTQKTNVVGDTGSSCQTITCPDGSVTTSCNTPSPIQQTLAPSPANPGGVSNPGNVPQAYGGVPSNGVSGGGSGQQQTVDMSTVNNNTAMTVTELRKITAGIDADRAQFVARMPGNGDGYEATDKTWGGEFQKLRTGLASTAVGQVVTGIFTIEIPASSCPVWTIPATELTPEIEINQQCAPVMENTVWPVTRAVLYVVTLLIAVTWAFL